MLLLMLLLLQIRLPLSFRLLSQQATTSTSNTTILELSRLELSCSLFVDTEQADLPQVLLPPSADACGMQQAAHPLLLLPHPRLLVWLRTVYGRGHRALIFPNSLPCYDR